MITVTKLSRQIFGVDYTCVCVCVCVCVCESVSAVQLCQGHLSVKFETTMSFFMPQCILSWSANSPSHSFEYDSALLIRMFLSPLPVLKPSQPILHVIPV